MLTDSHTFLPYNGVSDEERAYIREFFWWMTERQRIWQRRFEDDEDPPWTDDEILQEYHFCNVYRRLDRGTQFALDEILDRDDKRAVLFNILLYRFFNRPETYRRLGGFRDPDSFCVENAIHVLDIYGEDNSLFSPAYRVNTSGSHDRKHHNVLDEVIGDDVLPRLDELTNEVFSEETMAGAFDALRDIRGVGDFLAYELVTDLNYRHLPFSENDFVNVGPGAASGLSIIFGEPDVVQIMYLQENQDEFFDEFDLDFPYWQGKRLTLRSIEHSLCEWQKYMKIKEKGQSRRKFSPRDHAQNRLSDF